MDKRLCRLRTSLHLQIKNESVILWFFSIVELKNSKSLSIRKHQ